MQRQSNERQRFHNDSERWSAVLERDTEADGDFVYAVLTTGIFCRPSCPSRRPNRDNVSFYASARQAVDAGYRACKRCHPERAAGSHPHERAVLEACREIENAPTRPTLAQLARSAGLSPYHFQRVFKAVVGLTPKQYEKAHREHRLRERLTEAATVTDALYAAGYGSSGRFYADARGAIGMPPGTRRARGKGETIYFAVGECSLGTLVVAATGKGLCWIALGDSPDALVAKLQNEFSDATLLGGDAQFENTVANVVGLIENPGTDFNLPLDIRGTTFQKKVWRALTRIRSGTTASYAEVAAMIGKPSAVRAVAQACGANRLAVAIPCHRVVRSDGSLSGYRWGVDRKQTLLQREAGAQS